MDAVSSLPLLLLHACQLGDHPELGWCGCMWSLATVGAELCMEPQTRNLLQVVSNLAMTQFLYEVHAVLEDDTQGVFQIVKVVIGLGMILEEGGFHKLLIALYATYVATLTSHVVHHVMLLGLLWFFLSVPILEPLSYVCTFYLVISAYEIDIERAIADEVLVPDAA
jgi:hypothetical protein